jgi:hypothetical protein
MTQLTTTATGCIFGCKSLLPQSWKYMWFQNLYILESKILQLFPLPRPMTSRCQIVESLKLSFFQI